MRLAELRLKDVRNGMTGLVVYAGGCLHIADYEGGKFIVTRTNRRGLSVRGVERVWILLEGDA